MIMTAGADHRSAAAIIRRRRECSGAAAGHLCAENCGGRADRRGQNLVICWLDDLPRSHREAERVGRFGEESPRAWAGQSRSRQIVQSLSSYRVSNKSCRRIKSFRFARRIAADMTACIQCFLRKAQLANFFGEIFRNLRRRRTTPPLMEYIGSHDSPVNPRNARLAQARCGQYDRDCG